MPSKIQLPEFFQTFLPSENVQISSPQVAEEVNWKPTTLATQSRIFFFALTLLKQGLPLQDFCEVSFTLSNC
jgi:hypothetical protein